MPLFCATVHMWYLEKALAIDKSHLIGKIAVEIMDMGGILFDLILTT